MRKTHDGRWLRPPPRTDMYQDIMESEGYTGTSSASGHAGEASTGPSDVADAIKAMRGQWPGVADEGEFDDADTDS